MLFIITQHTPHDIIKAYQEPSYTHHPYRHIPTIQQVSFAKEEQPCFFKPGCFLLENGTYTTLLGFSRPDVLEAPPRFELGIKVLQTSALPLGYGAGYDYYMQKMWFCQSHTKPQSLTAHSEHFQTSPKTP